MRLENHSKHDTEFWDVKTVFQISHALLRSKDEAPRSVSEPHRRLTSSSGNDLLRGEVKEIPWIGRVVARPLGIGIVVEQRIQAEIVEIRKRKARTSVKESIGRKIVEIDAIVSIIGIEPILVAHVVVVDVVRVTEVSVVAKWRAVGELKIENAVAQRDFSREKCWRRISRHHDGAC